MNSGFFIAFSSGKCIGFVGVSGAIFCLPFLRFWMVDEDSTPSKTNPIYRPKNAKLSLETIRNSKMTYITFTWLKVPIASLLLRHHKLRGVEAVAPVRVDRKPEDYDPRDTTSGASGSERREG